MYSPGQKELAIQLRKQAKSYNEINAILSVPKSTLSTWLKDIPFSKAVKQMQLNRVKIIWANNITEHNRLRHRLFTQQAELFMSQCAANIKPLSDENLFFLFMGLFWGEGSKRAKHHMCISNSDPRFIRVALRFLRDVCHIPETKLRGSIHLHINNNPSTALEFWHTITHIPYDQLRTQLVVSSASKYKKPINSLPNGTFQLTVQSAEFGRQIMGWFNGTVKQAIGPE